MFTANILLVCQTAEWIWIQLLLYQFTQEEGTWAETALPRSSCSTVEKPATIKLHYSQTRDTLTP